MTSGRNPFAYNSFPYWTASGLPFTWQTRTCDGILNLNGGYAWCTSITYNWRAFGLDVLFYTVVGYVLLPFYQHRALTRAMKNNPVSFVVNGIEIVRRIVRVSSS
jgi:hypothetical protein